MDPTQNNLKINHEKEPSDETAPKVILFPSEKITMDLTQDNLNSNHDKEEPFRETASKVILCPSDKTTLDSTVEKLNQSDMKISDLNLDDFTSDSNKKEPTVGNADSVPSKKTTLDDLTNQASIHNPTTSHAARYDSITLDNLIPAVDAKVESKMLRPPAPNETESDNQKSKPNEKGIRMIESYLKYFNVNDLKLTYTYLDVESVWIKLNPPPIKPILETPLGELWDRLSLGALTKQDQKRFKFACEMWETLTFKQRMTLALNAKQKRMRGCTPYQIVKDIFDPNGFYSKKADDNDSSHTDDSSGGGIYD